MLYGVRKLLGKWEYIKLISKNGSRYGENGGVMDLLQWCDKPNTASVTFEEAMDFWESICVKEADKKTDK